MKILVTGTAGLIGSGVAMRLLERGDEVIGVYNVSDYYDGILNQARMARSEVHRVRAHVNGLRFCNR